MLNYPSIVLSKGIEQLEDAIINVERCENMHCKQPSTKIVKIVYRALLKIVTAMIINF